MDVDAFKIYIDRLHGGRRQEINETFPPQFLEIEEKELRFEKPIEASGEAYIAESELVLHLSVRAEALMPCSICNEMTASEVVLDNFYEVVPLETISSALFDYRDCLREEILLHLPLTVECRDGNCPSRKEMKHYLRAETPEKQEGFQPFSEL